MGEVREKKTEKSNKTPEEGTYQALSRQKPVYSTTFLRTLRFRI
jgi:hypothetical protein